MFTLQNIQYKKALALSPWRKISLGSWRPTGDSSIYTKLEIPMQNSLDFLAKNPGLNLNHLVAKIVAKAVEENPRINSVVRWQKIYPRENIDIFFHAVADKEGEDLSGITLRALQSKSLTTIAEEFERELKILQTQNDPRFRAVKQNFRYLPSFLARPVLDLMGFLQYTLNLRMDLLLGAPRDAFGSLMITNIGSLGILEAFTPIAPYSRIPLVIAMGKVHKAPMVVGEELKIVPKMILCFTFDHRLMEGVHFAKLARSLEKYFAHPELL